MQDFWGQSAMLDFFGIVILARMNVSYWLGLVLLGRVCWDEFGATTGALVWVYWAGLPGWFTEQGLWRRAYWNRFTCTWLIVQINTVMFAGWSLLSTI